MTELPRGFQVARRLLEQVVWYARRLGEGLGRGRQTSLVGVPHGLVRTAGVRQADRAANAQPPWWVTGRSSGGLTRYCPGKAAEGMRMWAELAVLVAKQRPWVVSRGVQ